MGSIDGNTWLFEWLQCSMHSGYKLRVQSRILARIPRLQKVATGERKGNPIIKWELRIRLTVQDSVVGELMSLQSISQLGGFSPGHSTISLQFPHRQTRQTRAPTPDTCISFARRCFSTYNLSYFINYMIPSVLGEGDRAAAAIHRSACISCVVACSAL